MRNLLRRLFAEISELTDAGDDDRRAGARQALAEVIERVELDPSTLSLRVHYAVRAGDTVASPRGSEASPVVRWSSELVALPARHARR